MDNLGALEAQLAPQLAALKPAMERVKALKEAIAAATPAGTQAIQGSRYGASVSEAGLVREIVSLPKLFKAIGERQFVGACSFPLKQLDALVAAGAVSGAQVKQILRAEHSGSRTVKTFPLAAQKAA